MADIPEAEKDMRTALLMSQIGDISEDQAVMLLAACDWDVAEASVMYVTNSTSKPAAPSQAAAKAPVATSTATVKSQATRPPRGNAHPKGEQYFVGGGPASGLAVVAPVNDNNNSNADAPSIVSQVFSKARENAEADDGASGRPSGVQPFSGVGRRVGHMMGDSLPIRPTLRQEVTVTITVYRNGFRVGEGPLESLDSPEGVQFFETLNNGIVPKRVADQHPDCNISAHLVDRTQDDFVPPPYVAFQGDGHRLTSDAPSAGSAPSTTIATTAVEVNESEETCKVIIINLMGERFPVVVNPARHTIADLYSLAKTKAQPGAAQFELVVRDFPPRPLKDLTQTIAEAKVSNCAVLMKRCS